MTTSANVPDHQSTPLSSYPAEMMRLESLPPAALAALSEQAPAFVPWAVDHYPTVGPSQAHPTRDEGLSVVRGHFRDPSVTDYVIDGFDKGLHALRIVAVLTLPDGKYRIVTVSEGPERADSLGATPTTYLSLDESSVQGISDLVVSPLTINSMSRVERYEWVPARREFLVVTPNER